MNDFYVYRYIRLDTNTPFYVGKGKGNRAYLLNSGRNQYFKNIVNSIPYEIEFILEDLTEEESFAKEMEFIKLYKSEGYCEANLTLGGEGVSGLVMSYESKAKMAAAKKGRKNPHKGYAHSEETKAKKSASLKGIAFTSVRKANISAAKKGKSFTEEHKLALSLGHGRKPRPWKSKKVLCIETNEIYETVQQASLILGIEEGTLRKQIRLKGRNRKTGLSFSYIENKKPQ